MRQNPIPSFRTLTLCAALLLGGCSAAAGSSAPGNDPQAAQPAAGDSGPTPTPAATDAAGTDSASRPTPGGGEADGGADSESSDAAPTPAEPDAAADTGSAADDTGSPVADSGTAVVDSALADSALADSAPVDSGVVMSVDDAGWTVLPPDPAGGTIYVSSSDPAASDSNSGLSASAPIKTVNHATTLAKAASVMHVLLKAGDTFDLTGGDLYITHGGTDAQHPFLVSSYGTGARPKLVIEQSDAGPTGDYVAIQSIGSLSHVAIVGLELAAPQGFDNNTEGSFGIRFAVGGTDTYDDVLFEDLLIHGFYNDIAIQTAAPAATNFRIRRCEILDSARDPSLTNPTDRPQGIYGQNVVDALIEENIFDNNGDGAGSTTQQGHSLYWQAGSFNATFHGNLVMDAPDSIQLRSGGTAEDNLFYKKAISLTFACLGTIGVPPTYTDGGYGITSPSSCQGIVKNNVMLDGQDLATFKVTESDGGTTTVYQPRALGLSMGVTSGIPTSSPADVTIASNIFAHLDDLPISQEPYAAPYAMAVQASVTTASVTGNVAYDWGTGLFLNTTAKAAVTLTDNQFQLVDTSTQPKALYLLWMQSPATLLATGNAYYSAATSPFVDGADTSSADFYDYATWTAKFPETGSSFAKVSYAKPTVDLGDYYAAATSTPSSSGNAAAFVAAARAQSKATWDSRFTAEAADAWFRTQFGVTAAP